MAQTGYYLPTITSLRAIDATVRSEGYARLVGETSSWYMFIAAATDSADNINVVQPVTGTGRWYRTKAVILAPDVQNLTEYVDDRIAALVVTSPTIEDIYDDNANQLVLSVRTSSIGDTQVSELSQSKIIGLSTVLNTKADTNHVHSPANITQLQEYIEDVVGGFLQNGTNIAIAYNDASNTLTISSTPTPLTIKDEGTALGNVLALNFTGQYVTTTVAGQEATVSITSPDVVIALQQQGTVKGNAKTINFTGSAVNSVVVTGDTAVVDLTGGTPSGTSILTEQNYIVTTSSAVLFNSQTTVPLNPEMVNVLRSVTTNCPARIRIYIDSTYAANDILRPVSTELSGEHGCLLEVITTPTNLVIDLAPPIVLYKKNSGTSLSMTINNLDNADRVFIVTLSSLKW